MSGDATVQPALAQNWLTRDKAGLSPSIFRPDQIAPHSGGYCSLPGIGLIVVGFFLVLTVPGFRGLAHKLNQSDAGMDPAHPVGV